MVVRWFFPGSSHHAGPCLTDTPQRLAGAILVGNPDHYPGQNGPEVSGDADSQQLVRAAILYYLRERMPPWR